jgi:hypothetical protein
MARAKLHAERVNIIKMVKVAGKWPFAPVVERNGRIIRDHVWVSGHEEHHPDGATTWNGTRREGVVGNQSRSSRIFSQKSARNPSCWSPQEFAGWLRDKYPSSRVSPTDRIGRLA